MKNSSRKESPIFNSSNNNKENEGVFNKSPSQNNNKNNFVKMNKNNLVITYDDFKNESVFNNITPTIVENINN